MRPLKFLLLVLSCAACSSERARPPEAPKSAALPSQERRHEEPPSPPSPTSEGERWFFRQVVVGRAIPEARRTTYELQLSPEKATMVVTHERAVLDRPAGSRTDEHALDWRTIKVDSFHGKQTETKGGTSLELSTREGLSLARTCTQKNVRVAPAEAVRVRTPGFTAECGDRGVWKPSTTTPLAVLVCEVPGETSSQDGVPAGGEVFARAPGVDYVIESSECYLQGGGLRLPP